jgi:Flp pilus assembly pilin Flp
VRTKLAHVGRESPTPPAPDGADLRSARMEDVMIWMKNVRSFLRNEDGTETLEWGLVCGLIVVGAIAAIALIGPKITAMWNNVNSSIP